MFYEIIKSIKIFLILSILLGILYPIFITLIAQLTMPHKANGSLIISDNKIRGSKLLAQEFSNPKYFHSRPSAVNYNSANSGASNLGPTNKQLFADVQKRINEIISENNLTSTQSIPADMVLQSASGLDPHISISNALFQLPRISKLRSIPEEEIHNLIKKHSKTIFFSLPPFQSSNKTFDNSFVNVLTLNLALDNLK